MSGSRLAVRPRQVHRRELGLRCSEERGELTDALQRRQAALPLMAPRAGPASLRFSRRESDAALEVDVAVGVHHRAFPGLVGHVEEQGVALGVVVAAERTLEGAAVADVAALRRIEHALAPDAVLALAVEGAVCVGHMAHRGGLAVFSAEDVGEEASVPEGRVGRRRLVVVVVVVVLLLVVSVVTVAEESWPSFAKYAGYTLSISISLPALFFALTGCPNLIIGNFSWCHTINGIVEPATLAVAFGSALVTS